jgi:hypothetical protein
MSALTLVAARARVAALLALLRDRSADADVQAQHCNELVDVMHAKPAAVASTAEDILAAVLGVLRQYMRHLGVTVKAYSVLVLLNQHTGCGAFFAQACSAGGVVPVFVCSFRTHATDANIQRAVAVVLLCCLRHASAAKEATRAGLAQAVVAALRAHAANVVLVDTCCHLLGNLAQCAPPEDRHVAIRAGAIEALTAVLRASCASGPVTQNGCCFAVAFFLHSSTNIEISSPLAIDTTAAVVAAMKLHADDTDLLRYGCHALASLGYSSRLDASLHAARASAFRVVVVALRAHAGAAAIQEAGCHAVRAMCECPALEDGATATKQAGAAGAVAAVLQALRTHVAVVSVQQAGCYALGTLCAHNARNWAEARAAGGTVELVVNALLAFPSDATLQKNGFMALTSMAVAERSRVGDVRTLTSAGAVHAVVAAMTASWSAESFSSANQVRIHALLGLEGLLQGGGAEDDYALRAGALEALLGDSMSRLPAARDAELRHLVRRLQAAAERHDAGACAHADCARCAGLRARGGMCALSGCRARTRADGKKLLRCGCCSAAWYCGAAHQREDWARHKARCGADDS